MRLGDGDGKGSASDGRNTTPCSVNQLKEPPMSVTRPQIHASRLGSSHCHSPPSPAQIRGTPQAAHTHQCPVESSLTAGSLDLDAAAGVRVSVRHCVPLRPVALLPFQVVYL
ncbi:protein phosphatase 6, catalytic subunit [Platysternon megacephalum]|uniref:Protein phosphatase 6, catalytic subunit n=1 Tax=Platysternon megacephalum TaxID=55544 RepID=A0A4D9EJQ1_9SAUR|nr:protein phosphatase 6, catalytic subunit [Platysternon megacephalum]